MSAKRGHADDNQACSGGEILTLPNALLAAVLSPCYLVVAKLMLVCVRFRDACQRPEFWMPVVRDYLRKHCPPEYAGIIPHVNPFFRFPSHMAKCPSAGWEWWRFLRWLMPGPGYGRIIYCKQDYMRRISINSYYAQGKGELLAFEEDDSASPMLRDTFWLLIEKGTQNAPDLCCLKSELLSTDETRYFTFENDKLIWRDGTVANGRRWCGAVTRDKTIVHPIEGQGFYYE
jgi:hypothetical protein